MQKKLTIAAIGILLTVQSVVSQTLFRVEGNGLFNSASSTNVDIRNTDDNTNALIRFGDNNQIKTSLGFNGNDDVFKISTATTLGVNDFTMDLNGLIGINSLPGAHRMLINHNSTSGVDGSAHLTLQENNTADFARLRFQNLGDDGFWVFAARATDGTSLLNFFHNDGTSSANIMSLDGNLFRVGIHETAPEAYLHIKQQAAGIDALVLENDDQTGGEKWGMQIGNTDLNFLFEGVIRGSFSSATGAYTAFPPPAAFVGQDDTQTEVLRKVLQLNPVRLPVEKSKHKVIGLNPVEVEQVDPDWVVRSEDGERLGINYHQFVGLSIRSIQEQQLLIEAQQKEIETLEAEEAALQERLALIEAKLAGLQPKTGTTPATLPGRNDATTLPLDRVQLQQNIPNPFREETLVRFSLPESMQLGELHLTNIHGQVVRKYSLSKGQDQLSIKSEGLQKGSYFYSLIVDGELIETKQLVIL